MLSSIFGFVLCTILLVVQFVSGSCPDGWMRHAGTCYYFSHDTEAMLVAKLSCKLLGGSLLEIETAMENAFVAGYIKDKYNFYYIGLNDIQKEGAWEWIGSKSSATYLNWHIGEPNSAGDDENCVVMSRSDGQWLDVACHRGFHYICEKKDIVTGIIGR